MKLSALRAHARIALTSHTAGDAQAAPELRAWALEHLEEIADALGKQPDVLRDALAKVTDDKLPIAFLATCTSKSVSDASRAAKERRLQSESHRLAAAISASTIVAEDTIVLDPVALYALASLRAAPWALFRIDGDEVYVPLEPLRLLAKIRKPSTWVARIHRRERRRELTVSWGTAGYWRSRSVLCTANPSRWYEVTTIHVSTHEAIDAAAE